jgi:hypothetical protein
LNWKKVEADNRYQIISQTNEHKKSKYLLSCAGMAFFRRVSWSFILTVCQYFLHRDLPIDPEYVFWYIVLGLVISTPLLGICYQIHSVMVLKEMKALKIRIVLNAISITGLAIIIRLYMGFDYLIIGCYSLAIIITSILFKVYRNKTEIISA